MVQNDISTWLQFALQQIAAESYLGGIDWNNPIALRDALVRGNKRQGVVEQNNTRMSVINIQRGRESVLDVLRYASPKLSAREEPGQGLCRFLSPSLIAGQRPSQRGESSSRFRRRRGLQSRISFVRRHCGRLTNRLLEMAFSHRLEATRAEQHTCHLFTHCGLAERAVGATSQVM